MYSALLGINKWKGACYGPAPIRTFFCSSDLFSSTHFRTAGGVSSSATFRKGISVVSRSIGLGALSFFAVLLIRTQPAINATNAAILNRANHPLCRASAPCSTALHLPSISQSFSSGAHPLARQAKPMSFLTAVAVPALCEGAPSPGAPHRSFPAITEGLRLPVSTVPLLAGRWPDSGNTGAEQHDSCKDNFKKSHSQSEDSKECVRPYARMPVAFTVSVQRRKTCEESYCSHRASLPSLKCA